MAQDWANFAVITGGAAGATSLIGGVTNAWLFLTRPFDQGAPPT